MCEKCNNALSATAAMAPAAVVAVELTTATTADPSSCLGSGSGSGMMPAALLDGGRKDSAAAATATAAITTWPAPSWRVTGSMCTTLTAVEAEGCSSGNAGTTAGSRTTAAAAIIVPIVASNGTGELSTGSDFCSAPLLSVLAPVVVVKVPAVAKADRGY